MMRPARYLLCAAGLAAALAGCTSKPTEEACDQAIVNIRKLTGQTHSEVGADRRAAVRSCRAQSNRDTVECYAEARTVEELYGCGGEMAEQVRAAEKKMGVGAAGSGGGSGSSGGSGSGAGSSGGPGSGAESGAGAGAGGEAAGSGEGSGSGW